MRICFFLVILTGSLGLASCKKDKSSKNEPVSAVVMITNPHDGDTIQGNFTLTGTIVGTANLHGYQITVTNTLNDSIIYQNEVHDHAANFTVNQAINHGFSNYTLLKLDLVAALDHDGNTTSKKVQFTVH
ncbi:hypothetical protein [Fluviicola sp.]|jgi:hypothetical protein|uniref:hypothetical protein n=1 Tax=Fluviicola sp. TaxID=1917219 RepID=UPI002826F7B4|nr:hypothetical protein [Fluviicola sp.]MDR0803074.1 hypothetical protein [Fluviicola sp.]